MKFPTPREVDAASPHFHAERIIETAKSKLLEFAHIPMIIVVPTNNAPPQALDIAAEVITNSGWNVKISSNRDSLLITRP